MGVSNTLDSTVEVRVAYAVLVKLVDLFEGDAGFDGCWDILGQLLPLASSCSVCGKDEIVTS
jgi:hypothetical protein